MLSEYWRLGPRVPVVGDFMSRRRPETRAGDQQRPRLHKQLKMKV